MNILKTNRKKKYNRGLLLGAALIIGLIIFLAIDSHNFKTEKPEIKKTVENFVSELGNSLVLDAEYQGKNAVPDSVKTEMTENFNNIIDKYWTSYNPSNWEWCYTESDMLRDYELYIGEFPRGYISEASYEATNISVKKNGPNSVRAEFDFYATITATSEALILTPTESYLINDWIESYEDDYYSEESTDITEEGEDTQENTPSAPETSQYCAEGELTLYLKRTADGWKIYKSDGWIYSLYEIV